MDAEETNVEVEDEADMLRLVRDGERSMDGRGNWRDERGVTNVELVGDGETERVRE